MGRIGGGGKDIGKKGRTYGIACDLPCKYY
jgi:hypothetical protein